MSIWPLIGRLLEILIFCCKETQHYYWVNDKGRIRNITKCLTISLLILGRQLIANFMGYIVNCTWLFCPQCDTSVSKLRNKIADASSSVKLPSFQSTKVRFVLMPQMSVICCVAQGKMLQPQNWIIRLELNYWFQGHSCTTHKSLHLPTFMSIYFRREKHFERSMSNPS